MARVMVVEDENIVARDIRETLELIGHEVPATAATGEDAIQKALLERPELILMDVRLRGAMDGITAAAKIREQLDVPIIFLTAFADPDSVARAKLTEPYGYVLKPYSDKELRSAIEVGLYRHSIERQLRDRERWFATILRSLGDGVIATNEADGVNFMNRAAETLTGWSQAEAMGRSAAEVFCIFREDKRISLECPTTRSMGQSMPAGLTNVAALLVSRSGQEVPIEYSAASIVDADEKVMGIVLVFRNVGERRKAARLQAAHAEIGQSALRSARLGDVLQDAVALVAAALETEYAAVWELLADGTTERLSWGIGWAPGAVAHATLPGEANSVAQHMLTSGKPMIIDDLAGDARFAASVLLREHGVRSGVSVVIASGSRPFGALSVFTRQPRTFTSGELSFLEAVASTLALTVERQRGEMQLIRSNRAHRALSSCNEAMIRATDELALLELVCRSIVEQAGYSFCWVGRKEHDASKSVTPLAHAGHDGDYLTGACITWEDSALGRGPTGTCVRTGETQFTPSVASDPAFQPWRSAAMKRGYTSVVAIPLHVEAVLFGALTIYSDESDAFAPDEMRLLSELAADLGYGIASLRTRAALRGLNAELEQRVVARTRELQQANVLKDELLLREQQVTQALHHAQERENAVGAKIQQMLLLDQPPQNMQAFKLAALTLPSRWIAGDFYEFFRHDNDCIDLIVADVMGKGIPAALLAAATKSHFLEALCHLMRATPAGELPEPQDIVTLAQTNMVRQLLDLESFVTLCYARFDLCTYRVALVDCGHTGTLHWRASSRDCVVLHGDNLPLGVPRENGFSKITVPFEGDDIFVFYSDGITEARNSRGELFGLERLVECVTAYIELQPEALVAKIRERVLAFSQPAPLADDLTCVTMKAVAEPAIARANLEIPSQLSELPRARAFVRELCRKRAGAVLAEHACEALELAVNEAASNIMKHAYHGRTDQLIALEAEVFRTHVSIRLHHSGDAFDPASVPPPVCDGTRDSGFGVYMIAQSVDDARYYLDSRGRKCISLRQLRR